MALSPSNLSVLAYANGFTLWHYKTADDAATVDTAGYFNGFAGSIRVGDMIMANAGIGGSPAYGIFVVNDNNGSVVDVANLTAFGSSDSD